MSHPARGPGHRPGIDGKANASKRRREICPRPITVAEAAA